LDWPDPWGFPQLCLGNLSAKLSQMHVSKFYKACKFPPLVLTKNAAQIVHANDFGTNLA
jgi:hypothetical protein